MVRAAAGGVILAMVVAGGAFAARPGAEQLGTVATRPAFVSPYPPLGLAAGLAVVLGAVWLTYGYVLYQVWRIARQRGSG